MPLVTNGINDSAFHTSQKMIDSLPSAYRELVPDMVAAGRLVIDDAPKAGRSS